MLDMPARLTHHHYDPATLRGTCMTSDGGAIATYGFLSSGRFDNGNMHPMRHGVRGELPFPAAWRFGG
jgi:hypothetical protein